MQPTPVLLVSLLLTAFTVKEAAAATIPVANVAAFKAAVPRLQPGDTLVLAAGTWQDAQLVFKGKGTEKQPIVLRAAKPGAVQLQGSSSLQLAGEYLVVMGLQFLNGNTPLKSVIEFRENSKNLAAHCRVTECVIDSYNQTDRTKEDSWVHLYGQHNRFDHNYLGGKKNPGVTLVVDLSSDQSQNNYHRIDHNYFGPRPRLGSNGGETMRIGVSTYSLTASHTLVEENYFYQCSGEVEIISIKSGENVVRRNLFVECEGSVVLRHGNNNLLEGNYFLGNGKEQTGGIRVINAGHRILNNYFADLKGTDFRAALAIMNGVPNSPLNRYNQVRDVTIEGNTFVNCDNIELAVGKDAERTAKPENVTIKGNTFYAPKTDKLFTAHDDLSGITFQDNLIHLARAPTTPSLTLTTLSVQKSADGLLVPTKSSAKTTLGRPVTEAETGPRWFRPEAAKGTPRTGKVWLVPSSQPDALRRACQTAQAGDIIELTQTGPYLISQTIEVQVPLTLRAKAGLASRPVLRARVPEMRTGATPARQPLFSIENGGTLHLTGLALDGAGSTAAGLVQPSVKLMLDHYSFWAGDCAFYGLQAAESSIFRATTASFADTLQFVNCLFYNIKGDALSLATEKDNKGTYNAEYVLLKNCLFREVQGAALDLYRGGNDESTLGPFLHIDHCTFDNVGNGSGTGTLKLTGVQWSNIRNCLFNNSGRAGVAIQYTDKGKGNNQLTNTNLYQSGRIAAEFPPRTVNVTTLPTVFRAPQQFDYRLKTPVPQLPTATDGRPVGFLAAK